MIDINPIRLKDVRPMSGDGWFVEGSGIAIDGSGYA